MEQNTKDYFKKNLVSLYFVAKGDLKYMLMKYVVCQMAISEVGKQKAEEERSYSERGV